MSSYGMDDLSNITYPAKPFEISFYDDFNIENISLYDFEKLAFERRKLLNMLHVERTHKADTDELKKRIQCDLIRKYDKISHYLLAMCACVDEESTRYFITEEAELFELQLHNVVIKDILKNFIKGDITVERKSIRDFFEDEDVNEAVVKFAQAYKSKEDKNINYLTPRTYYVTNFQSVPDLVARRYVYLMNGKAYFEEDKLYTYAKLEFEESLTQSLAKLKKHIDSYLKDPRIGSIIRNLFNQYSGNDFSNIEVLDTLTRNTIPSIMNQNAPLCMRLMTQFLVRNHHIKNAGFLQLILFYKGCGVSMVECVEFFKRCFTVKTPLDAFNKEYAYRIRFLYGKEGKRANYSPFNCVKIVNSVRVLDSCNGCPYKYLSSAELKQCLRANRVKDNDIEDIISLAKDGSYDVACRRHYTSTHPGSDNIEIGLHPNEWFKTSFEYFKEREKNVEQSHSSSQTSPSKH